MLKFSYRFWLITCMVNIILGVVNVEVFNDSETAVMNLSVGLVCLIWAVNLILEEKIRENNKKTTQKDNQRSFNRSEEKKK